MKEADTRHAGVRGCEERGRTSLLRTLDSCLTDRRFAIEGRPVRFRLLRVEDVDLWTDFVNGCSKESLWLRFMVPFSATPERARRFCDIDPEKEFAVIAEMIEGPRSRVIGIARLIRLSGSGKAEFALIVADPWQRKKLGRVLSELSVELAKSWGVQVVFSETMMENHVMIRVLKNCRFQVEERNGNVFTLALRLS